MASNLSDLIIAYRVMSQPDPTDNVQGAFGLSVPPRPSAKKYIGVWREWLDQAHPAVLQIYNKALDYLTTQAGYQVVDISLPNVKLPWSLLLSAIALRSPLFSVPCSLFILYLVYLPTPCSTLANGGDLSTYPWTMLIPRLP